MPVGTSSAAVNLAAASNPRTSNSPAIRCTSNCRTTCGNGSRAAAISCSTSARLGRAIYGVTTGFGPLVEFAGRADSAGQSDNTIIHHIVGHGELLPPAVARAAVLARLFSLAHGRSGVSEHVVDALVAMLDTEFAPAVPRLGSVGASGDLQPLAYVAHALRGNGNAFFRGRLMPAAEALTRAGSGKLVLDGRDALALVNGISVTAAALGLAVAQAGSRTASAQLLSALLTDVLGCGIGVRVGRPAGGVRPSGRRGTRAPRMRTWLAGQHADPGHVRCRSRTASGARPSCSARPARACGTWTRWCAATWTA